MNRMRADLHQTAKVKPTQTSTRKVGHASHDVRVSGPADQLIDNNGVADIVGLLLQRKSDTFGVLGLIVK